jgi:hypothetical protein
MNAMPLLLALLSLQALISPVRLRLGDTPALGALGTLWFCLGGLLSMVALKSALMSPSEDTPLPTLAAHLGEWSSMGFVLAVVSVAVGVLWTRHELRAGRRAYRPIPPPPGQAAAFSGSSTSP